MQKTFTKTFSADGRFRELPDSDYWLAREEHILSYLWQRGASVPKVNFKDNANKNLILENVGESLDVILKRADKFNSKLHTAEYFFETLILSVQALEDIFDLGVLHLDIALRNLVSNATQSDKVFVIDFSHALIRISRTQKPIPLVPVDGLHHPLLVRGLVNDWNKFLAFSGQPPLVPPYDINISKESFARFWSDELEIQDMATSRAVLCHGIGNLFIESSNCSWLTSTQSDQLKALGSTLQNRSESDAQHLLMYVKKEIRDLVGNKAYANLDATIVPKLSQSRGQLNDSKYSQPKLPAPDALRLFVQAYAKVGPLALEITAWLMVAGQIWWVNFAIEVSRTRLSDSVLNWLVAGGIVSLLALGRSLVMRPDERVAARLQGVLCILSTEGVVLLSLPASQINLLVLWIPAVAVGAACLLIYLSVLKKISLKNN